MKADNIDQSDKDTMFQQLDAVNEEHRGTMIIVIRMHHTIVRSCC